LLTDPAAYRLAVAAVQAAPSISRPALPGGFFHGVAGKSLVSPD
jgi:hypothetical protein